MTIYAPKTHPKSYGFKKGDYHLIVNAQTKTVKGYSFEGKLLFERPCLAEGQRWEWWKHGGDTPPSVYKLGALYNDKANGSMQPAYGWCFFDMVDLGGNQEDGEDANGRSGVGLHGGGSGAPQPFAPYQKLLPTLGCLRMYNQDLYDYILPLYEKGAVFVSVFQDNK